MLITCSGFRDYFTRDGIIMDCRRIPLRQGINITVTFLDLMVSFCDECYLIHEDHQKWITSLVVMEPVSMPCCCDDDNVFNY